MPAKIDALWPQMLKWEQVKQLGILKNRSLN